MVQVYVNYQGGSQVTALCGKMVLVIFFIYCFLTPSHQEVEVCLTVVEVFLQWVLHGLHLSLCLSSYGTTLCCPNKASVLQFFP